MFGFSFQKLLFTGFVIAAIIYGFRWFSAMQLRNQQVARKRSARQNPSTEAAHDDERDENVELMIECKPCGAYVSASGARSCGREDCPYPG